MKDLKNLNKKLNKEKVIKVNQELLIDLVNLNKSKMMMTMMLTLEESQNLEKFIMKVQ